MLPLLFIMVIASACGNDSEGESNNDNTDEKTSVETESAKRKTASSLGQKMFILCSACHSLKKGEPSKVGPNLYGIFGKQAAQNEEFIFSEALKASEIVWTEENMYKWLEDPAGFIPGSNMAFVGIKNEKQLKALMEYLKEETK